jgi:hypothetical protein
VAEQGIGKNVRSKGGEMQPKENQKVL